MNQILPTVLSRQKLAACAMRIAFGVLGAAVRAGDQKRIRPVVFRLVLRRPQGRDNFGFRCHW
jgi:hypothetical protein